MTEEEFYEVQDFVRLFKKYIKYIKEVEGTDYITLHEQRHFTDVKFTDEEWDTLNQIAESV